MRPTKALLVENILVLVFLDRHGILFIDQLGKNYCALLERLKVQDTTKRPHKEKSIFPRQCARAFLNKLRK